MEEKETSYEKILQDFEMGSITKIRVSRALLQRLWCFVEEDYIHYYESK